MTSPHQQRAQIGAHVERTQSIAQSLVVSILSLVGAIRGAIDEDVPLKVDTTVDELALARLPDDDADTTRVRAAAALVTPVIEHAWDVLERKLSDVCSLASLHMGAIDSLPKDIYSASAQLAGHQVEYERIARKYLDALADWRVQDATQARVRARVRDRLMYLNDDGSKSATPRMSATAADKAASGDDEYTTHKDQLALLSDVKDEADVERSVAFEKVQTSRALLAALVQIELVKRGRAQQTLVIGPAAPRDPADVAKTAEHVRAFEQSLKDNPPTRVTDFSDGNDGEEAVVLTARAAIVDALPLTDAGHRLATLERRAGTRIWAAAVRGLTAPQLATLRALTGLESNVGGIPSAPGHVLGFEIKKETAARGTSER